MIRLDRYLSEGGKFTRREAGEAVRRGLVAVNGETVRDPSRKVDETADRITVEGADFRYTEFRYVKLNKPAGYVSTTDPGERSVMDLVPPEFRRAGAFPCGRLDIDTTGLLLITNDGQLAHELLSPRHHCEKTYHYRCRPVDGEQIRRLEEGLDRFIYHYKMFSLEIADKACSRINVQRSSTDYESVCICNCLNSAFNSFVIKSFLIKHNIRFYNSTTLFAVRNLFAFFTGFNYELVIVKLVAL